MHPQYFAWLASDNAPAPRPKTAWPLHPPGAGLAFGRSTKDRATELPKPRISEGRPKWALVVKGVDSLFICIFNRVEIIKPTCRQLQLLLQLSRDSRAAGIRRQEAGSTHCRARHERSGQGGNDTKGCRVLGHLALFLESMQCSLFIAEHPNSYQLSYFIGSCSFLSGLNTDQTSTRP